MKLTCKDSSDGKLFLALDFLSFLNTFAEHTHIICPEANSSLYQPLSKLFSNLKFSSFVEKDVDLEFFDRQPQGQPEHLIYRILTEAPQPEYFNSNLLPVIKSDLFPGFWLPEFNSAKIALNKQFSKQDFIGKKILISAGPTAEDLDPVRFFSNRSSGKMGISLACAAYERGADVQLVYGPGRDQVPAIIKSYSVRSAAEMAENIIQHFSVADIYIASAAVADFTPAHVAQQKIKKGRSEISIKMKRTQDILHELNKIKKQQKMIGFSLETEKIIENSLHKLQNKNLDMIVVNNPLQQGSGFAVDTNKVSVLFADGNMFNLPLMHKYQLSHKLLDYILKLKDKNV